MKMKFWARLALIAVVLLFLIQIIPYGRNHSNPPITKEPQWDSPQTRALAKRACFDCHSHETVWPWYANVAPMSWLVFWDVAEGREEMNFSEWKDMSPGEIVEVIEEGEMPPAQYTIAHPEARLTEAEKKALAAGLHATVLATPR